jgi:hypothetical protein
MSFKNAIFDPDGFQENQKETTEKGIILDTTMKKNSSYPK